MLPNSDCISIGCCFISSWKHHKQIQMDLLIRIMIALQFRLGIGQQYKIKYRTIFIFIIVVKNVLIDPLFLRNSFKRKFLKNSPIYRDVFLHIIKIKIQIVLYFNCFIIIVLPNSDCIYMWVAGLYPVRRTMYKSRWIYKLELW